MERLMREAQGRSQEIFGTRPEIPEYVPINLTQSMLDTVGGNLRVLPQAEELARGASEANLNIDLERARRLLPGYDDIVAANARAALGLSQGQMPFGDAMGIVENRGAMASRMGTAGTGVARAGTMRDLGMGRMQAMDMGQNLFQRMANMAAQAISPLSRQIGVEYSFLTPFQRAQMDIQQQQLRHGSQVQQAMASAMPDPGASQMFMLQAQQGQQAPMNYMDWGGLIGQAGGMFANAWGAYNQNQMNNRLLASQERAYGQMGNAMNRLAGGNNPYTPAAI